MKSFNEKIGSQLAKARETKKYSYGYMGNAIGCSKSTYYYYENGVRSFPIETLISACKILGLDWAKVVENANKK